MPPEGVSWKPHDSMLKFEEILRVCRIMAELGVSRVKVTGGEPLVRRGVASFIKSLKELSGIEKVSMTTNALLLGAFLDEAETGPSLPDWVNISLNSLDAGRLAKITGTQGLKPEEILSLIKRLLGKRVPVKINCVPVRGYNNEDIVPLAALAKDNDIAVRFIELMPLGCASELMTVSGDETAALLEKTFGVLTPFGGVEGSGPAIYYSLPSFAGKIGFINPVSKGFCAACNRLRLTSEGFLKSCLSSSLGVDLKALLRGGASDVELSAAITEAAAKKPKYHTLSEVYGADGITEQHEDGMSKIGG